MKRLIICALALAVLITPSYGRRRTRTQRRIIQLTEPDMTGTMTLEQALAKRHSVTQFTNESLKPFQISQLAWAGQGITEPQKGLRTTPSLGGLHPIELLFATSEGVFVYQPPEHRMEQISDQDIRVQLAGATSMPESVAGAACDIIIAGSIRALSERFQDKAPRQVYRHGKTATP